LYCLTFVFKKPLVTYKLQARLPTWGNKFYFILQTAQKTSRFCFSYLRSIGGTMFLDNKAGWFT